MSERADSPDHDEPDEWSDTTEVQFKVSSTPIGKLETSVSGPAKAVVKIVQIATGIVLLLGAGPVLRLGSDSAYASWFVALAILMASLGAVFLYRWRS